MVKKDNNLFILVNAPQRSINNGEETIIFLFHLLNKSDTATFLK